MSFRIPCAICSGVSSAYNQDDCIQIDCQSCGRGEITLEALARIQGYPSSKLQWLRCAFRQAYDGGTPLKVVEADVDRLIAEHEATSVSANVEKLLIWLMRKSLRPGICVPIFLNTNLSIIDVAHSGELTWYLEYLCESGLITADTQLSGEPWAYALTFRAWEYLTGPSASAGTRGRCFVAMSFQPMHDEIYRRAILPAVTTAGYQAICLKDELTNGDINDRILTEIRKAQIIVADFTGQRGGVYFEAGFALALKKEVYWTCKKEEMKEVHFDINHFQHIDWIDYDDFQTRLREKITALSGVGPHLQLKR